MITKEQQAALNADLPASAVRSRDKAGQTLSYVEGWWVIDRLNAILGIGAWSFDATDTREVYREQRADGKWCVSYSARCRLSAAGVTIGDVGHGHGVDKSCGNAVESAEKEAATDALKRCARALGRSMGLALYDKTQEHVAEERPATPPAPTVDAALDARVMRDWEAMPREELRAAWPMLSADTKAQINAAKAARKVVA